MLCVSWTFSLPISLPLLLPLTLVNQTKQPLGSASALGEFCNVRSLEIGQIMTPMAEANAPEPPATLWKAAPPLRTPRGTPGSVAWALIARPARRRFPIGICASRTLSLTRPRCSNRPACRMRSAHHQSTGSRTFLLGNRPPARPQRPDHQRLSEEDFRLLRHSFPSETHCPIRAP